MDKDTFSYDKVLEYLRGMRLDLFTESKDSMELVEDHFKPSKRYSDVLEEYQKNVIIEAKKSLENESLRQSQKRCMTDIYFDLSHDILAAHEKIDSIQEEIKNMEVCKTIVFEKIYKVDDQND